MICRKAFLKPSKFIKDVQNISQENRINSRGDPLHWPHDALYLQKLALTSPTSGGRLVSILRLPTKGHGVYVQNISAIKFCILFFSPVFNDVRIKKFIEALKRSGRSPDQTQQPKSINFHSSFNKSYSWNEVALIQPLLHLKIIKYQLREEHIYEHL
jgi:hypothetical protein